MPYTPPSQLSPATSAATTPTPSRSSSYLKSEYSVSVERPHLPRSHGSTSYLNKSRRSPTVSQHDIQGPMTDSERGIAIDPHGSMRQSPPPRTNGLIPSGMTISPPDSSHNSDDEEVRGRSRELENLAELQAAISQIRVRRAASPSRDEAKRDASEGNGPLSIDTRPPLSREARKISHSRSNTDSNIIFDPPTQIHVISPESPISPRPDSSEEDSDDGPTLRPPMVRKKSGELVRPALRPASRRRPSSMPGTPTYSKAVHFDSHLEHVRHFLQVDKPLAVSAGSSPVEAYESENEFPFGSDEASARSRSPQYEWEIRLANFPSESEDRTSWPIHVERVFLSSDGKNLIGVCAVHNLSFQKFVVARFTLDYWKTTSEVVADFNNDVRKQQQDGFDRFNFSIRLADQANLENKTLFFCVRYNVNGQEYWDSNNSFNYQVDFTKKIKPHLVKQHQPSGLGARPISALPRSRPSPPVSSGRSANRGALPASFDDFASNFDNFGVPFGSSPNALIGEPKIKLRSPRSKGELVPDAPLRRNKSSGPMFGHRYDFNSSLTAAKNSALSILGEQSGLSSIPGAKQSSREVPAVAAALKSLYDAPQKQANGVRSVSASVDTPVTSSKPISTLASDKPPLTSQSYQELVEKYCFFGTHKNSTPLTKTALNMVDGADDPSSSDMSIGSAQSSGSSTPTANGGRSPPSESSSWKSISNHNTRSSSPLPQLGSCGSSRSASPTPYGSYHPFNSPSQTILAEIPVATAIRG